MTLTEQEKTLLTETVGKSPIKFAEASPEIKAALQKLVKTPDANVNELSQQEFESLNTDDNKTELSNEEVDAALKPTEETEQKKEVRQLSELLTDQKNGKWAITKNGVQTETGYEISKDEEKIVYNYYAKAAQIIAKERGITITDKLETPAEIVAAWDAIRAKRWFKADGTIAEPNGKSVKGSVGFRTAYLCDSELKELGVKIEDKAELKDIKDYAKVVAPNFALLQTVCEKKKVKLYDIGSLTENVVDVDRPNPKDSKEKTVQKDEKEKVKSDEFLAAAIKFAGNHGFGNGVTLDFDIAMTNGEWTNPDGSGAYKVYKGTIGGGSYQGKNMQILVKKNADGSYTGNVSIFDENWSSKALDYGYETLNKKGEITATPNNAVVNTQTVAPTSDTKTLKIEIPYNQTEAAKAVDEITNDSRFGGWYRNLPFSGSFASTHTISIGDKSYKAWRANASYLCVTTDSATFYYYFDGSVKSGWTGTMNPAQLKEAYSTLMTIREAVKQDKSW